MPLFEDFTGLETPVRKPFAPPKTSGVMESRVARLDGLHARLPVALRREFYESGATTGDHRHLDFVALYAVRGGSGLHMVNGVAAALAKGDIYLLAPGSLHSYVRYENLEIDALYFAPELLRDEELAALRALPGFWSLFSEIGDKSDARLHLRPEESRPIEAQLATLRALWKRDDAAALLLLRGAIFALLVHLAWRWETRTSNGASTAATPPDISPAPTMADAVRWCETHFAQPLSVPQLAARMFVSPNHFSGRFKREVGVAPAAFIRHLRLEKARALLRETDWPLSRIAAQTGWADAAHLARSFRAFYGQTPGAFRTGE